MYKMIHNFIYFIYILYITTNFKVLLDIIFDFIKLCIKICIIYIYISNLIYNNYI